MTAEPFGACNRCQDAFGLGEKRLTRMIEIVRVLVVTEQHGIDFADRLGAERGAG
jgi:hypothetical protein